jgi:glutaredoxin-like YruB-family protein
MMMEVNVYTTPACPWCKKVKAFLKENGVDYKEIDVTDESAAKEMVEKSGQMSVPVIDVDGDIIIGYDEGKLRNKFKGGEKNV